MPFLPSFSYSHITEHEDVSHLKAIRGTKMSMAIACSGVQRLYMGLFHDTCASRMSRAAAWTHLVREEVDTGDDVGLHVGALCGGGAAKTHEHRLRHARRRIRLQRCSVVGTTRKLLARCHLASNVTLAAHRQCSLMCAVRWTALQGA